LLEIGCGSGSDLEFFSEQKLISNIVAIDLGLNVIDLAQKYQNREDISVQQGNALSLKFKDETFDTIYSYGVFHHTADPIKCLQEAHRVLKRSGKMFLYLYGSHENNIIKRVGVSIEGFIMAVFSRMPYSLQNIFCYLISPVCWFIFTLPSNLLRLVGLKVLAKKFPFYFGGHPFSLTNDLKDRLMSPVNHRFTKKNLEQILLSNHFQSFDVVRTSAGLYVYAEKS
jgi:SAM-dependent methyltransferase